MLFFISSQLHEFTSNDFILFLYSRLIAFSFLSLPFFVHFTANFSSMKVPLLNQYCKIMVMRENGVVFYGFIISEIPESPLISKISKTEGGNGIVTNFTVTNSSTPPQLAVLVDVVVDKNQVSNTLYNGTVAAYENGYNFVCADLESFKEGKNLLLAEFNNSRVQSAGAAYVKYGEYSDIKSIDTFIIVVVIFFSFL